MGANACKFLLGPVQTVLRPHVSRQYPPQQHFLPRMRFPIEQYCLRCLPIDSMPFSTTLPPIINSSIRHLGNSSSRQFVNSSIHEVVIPSITKIPQEDWRRCTLPTCQRVRKRVKGPPSPSGVSQRVRASLFTPSLSLPHCAPNFFPPSLARIPDLLGSKSWISPPSQLEFPDPPSSNSWIFPPSRLEVPNFLPSWLEVPDFPSLLARSPGFTPPLPARSPGFSSLPRPPSSVSSSVSSFVSFFPS